MRKIVEKSMLGQAWVGVDYSGDETDASILSVDGLVARVLASRGITGADAERFLNPSIKEYMPNPSVLTDMDRAAALIADAICAGKKIAIYGDYDVDGITSTAIFIKYLRALGGEPMWHLPTREGEGYGLNIAAIEELAAAGVQVLITVDCGISGNAEVVRAKELGMTVIVTDHHSPDVALPAADAIVNPKRADDTSGMQYLAGVGVAFLTLVAINRELKTRATGEIHDRATQINLIDYLDFVALGTVCDTMPLVGLNRAFVATGLRVLGLRGNLGLRVLMDVANLKHPSVYAAGFGIGPRLNAAGRLDSASPALELLLTDNALIACDLAGKLDAMNRERIGIQNAIMLEATELSDDLCNAGRCSIFVCGDNWHGGVMGIIAGRLKDKFNRPVCVATRNDGMINGSGRSIPGVDLGRIVHEALAAGILSEGGGHAAAAGFSLTTDKEAEFAEFLETSVSNQLNGHVPAREVSVDAELDAGAATLDLLDRISALEPFGQGNPEPTLVLHGGVFLSAKVIKFAHISGVVKTSSGTSLHFVGFNLVGTPVGNFLLDAANKNTKIMMLGRLKTNEHNGRVSAQFFLEDLAVE